MQGIFNVAADGVVLNYFEKVWISLWLLIDQIVYGIMSLVYQVFYMITEVNLFNNSGAIGEITERIYVVFGVVMLFVFAYNILLLIANPDKLSGKDNGMTRLIRDTVISIVLVALLPTIFDAMYAVQHRVLETNIIGNIILGGTSVGGQTSDSPRQQVKDAGAKVATTIFSTFYHPIKNEGGEEIDYTPADCRNDSSVHSLCETYISAIDNANNSGRPTVLIRNKTLNDNIPKDNMKYMYIVSTLCGALAVYLFVSFALDVGLRAVKLAVLQVVAPVPIMLRITKPTGGIFSKWFKEIKETYISLFVRLAIIYFAMFTIDLVISYYDAGSLFEEYGVGMVSILAELVLILSILAFAKDAPKLLKNLTGGAGGVEWNIKKKLNSDTYEYGRRAMGAAGTVGRNLGRGLFNSVFQRNEDGTYSFHNGKSFTKAAGRNFRNILRAPIYGAYRGWKNSGGNIENLGQEIKKSSIETTAMVDKHETFRERAKKNAVVGFKIGDNEIKIPGIGARLLTRADDFFDAKTAEGGWANFLGNRINYTTSGVSADKAGTFRKHHANIIDSDLIQSGIKGIKEQAMREEEHTREFYNNRNLAINERISNLRTSKAFKDYIDERDSISTEKARIMGSSEYQAYNSEKGKIDAKFANLRNDADYSSYITTKEKIDVDVSSYNQKYNLEIEKYNRERLAIQSENQRLAMDTNISQSDKDAAIRALSARWAQNESDLKSLEVDKVKFEKEISDRKTALSQSRIGVEVDNLNKELETLQNNSSVYHELSAVNSREQINENSSVKASIDRLNSEKAANLQTMKQEIDNIKDRSKAEINEQYRKNFTKNAKDIHAYYINNLREIREEFNAIPVSAQNIILEEAGFNVKEEGFNPTKAFIELGQRLQKEENQEYTAEDVDAIRGFIRGLKKVENRGPFDYRLSRAQDATGAKKDGGK